MNQLPDLTGRFSAFAIGVIVCGAAGWVVIEGAIWIGNRISIGWTS